MGEYKIYNQIKTTGSLQRQRGESGQAGEQKVRMYCVSMCREKSTTRRRDVFRRKRESKRKERVSSQMRFFLVPRANLVGHAFTNFFSLHIKAE